MKLPIREGFLLLNALFFSISPFFSQQDTMAVKAKKVRKIKVLPVPAFGYEPETKAHFGAVALFTINLHQDSLTRVSNAKLEFNYTLRKQTIIESEWNYFSKREEWFTKGLLHFSIYPDFFYGIGANTLREDEILFNSQRVKTDIELYKNLGKKIFVGGGFRYFNYNSISSDTIISNTALKDASNFGIRASVFRDNRNNLLSASKGSFYELDVEYNFSSENYIRTQLDLRKYFILKHDFVIATRLLNQTVIGTPSFYDYSVMGGDDFVRGYFYGRYRDKNLSTLQTEVRTPLLWRCGLAFIGGVSSLYADFDSFGTKFRPNYGVGFRFLVDKAEKINLRFDYVLGSDDNNGFYVSFGESF